jgi:hypothetical protein
MGAELSLRPRIFEIMYRGEHLNERIRRRITEANRVTWLVIVHAHQQIRGASTKYVSLAPFSETKHNFMEIFIATDTAIVQQFFNIFTTGIETFVIPWDQIL